MCGDRGLCFVVLPVVTFKSRLNWKPTGMDKSQKCRNPVYPYGEGKSTKAAAVFYFFTSLSDDQIAKFLLLAVSN